MNKGNFNKQVSKVFSVKQPAFPASICLFLFVSAFGPLPHVSAAHVPADITLAQANSNSAYLQFTIPMADNDIVFKTGMEPGEVMPNLAYAMGKTGNQSIVSSPGKGRVVQLRNTITTNEGNWFFPELNQTYGTDSAFQIPVPRLIANNRMSLQYDLKLESGSTLGVISFLGNIHKDHDSSIYTG